MRLPWRRNRPKDPTPPPVAAPRTPIEDEYPRIVPFPGDLEDTATLKYHAVRALCALLMDRHDACVSEHQFCGPHTHYKNGDDLMRVIAHPIPQAMASGEDLLGIYLCQAESSLSGDALDPLEYTASLTCVGRVPHRKVVAQLCDNGSYYLSVGPLLNTVEDDHSTGRLDQQSARQAVIHPEPAFTRWEYYAPQLATGPLRVIPKCTVCKSSGSGGSRTWTGRRERISRWRPWPWATTPTTCVERAGSRPPSMGVRRANPGRVTKMTKDWPTTPAPARPKRKRARATVVAEQDGKTLLIRERGSRQFSLPGGGIERGEYTMEAALRELREETKLRPYKAERMFDYEGTSQLHKVVRVQARGHVRLQRKEVSEFKWWNGREQLSMLPSARAIIEKCR